MRYIHLPPASKIAWDQAPQWGGGGNNRGETAKTKTKTGEQSKPSGGIGRGKGQTTSRLSSLPYDVISVRNTSTSSFSELLPVQHNHDQPKYNYTCCACSNQPLWSQNCCRTILEDHSLLIKNDQLASL